MAAQGNTRHTFGDGSAEPLYLTNGCCEPTHDYLEDLFADLGLQAGEFEGDFYPLTSAEERFIGEDYADVADGCGALMGYSAIYRGEKFLMPSIEVVYGEGGVATRDEALAFGRGLSEELRERVEAVGGHVFLDEDHGGDRHLIQVLVPFAYATSQAKSFGEWKAHLEDTLLASGLRLRPGASPAP